MSLFASEVDSEGAESLDHIPYSCEGSPLRGTQRLVHFCVSYRTFVSPYKIMSSSSVGRVTYSYLCSKTGLELLNNPEWKKYDKNKWTEILLVLVVMVMVIMILC